MDPRVVRKERSKLKMFYQKTTHPTTIISRLPIKLIKEYGIKWQVPITFALASGQGHKTGVLPNYLGSNIVNQ